MNRECSTCRYGDGITCTGIPCKSIKNYENWEAKIEDYPPKEKKSFIQECVESAKQIQEIGNKKSIDDLPVSSVKFDDEMNIIMNDIVEHPSHYTAGKFETIEIIRDQVQDIKSYLHGNCIKYLSRYRYKNGVEDLKKCKQYLEWLILECEK